MQTNAGAKWGIGLQAGGTGSWQTLMPFAWSNGADLTKDGGKAYNFDSPEILEATKYYQSYFTDGISDKAAPATPTTEPDFKSGKVPLQALLVVYPNRMHVVTVEGTGIETMADLKGKRVSTGSPGGATEVMAFRVIEAAGLDKDKDMKRERLGVAESVNAIKDRKIDAFFWVGGIPTAAVTDLAATPGMKMKLIDHSETADKMNAKYGKLYTAAKIPAGAYPGQDKDNAITEVWNLIVTGGKMSDDDAYAIVKTLVEKKADIVAVHKEAESFSLDNQVQERSPIPFHPGALKYFKEKGIGG